MGREKSRPIILAGENYYGTVLYNVKSYKLRLSDVPIIVWPVCNFVGFYRNVPIISHCADNIEDIIVEK